MGTQRNDKKLSFEPPTHVAGEDWVLVLDDAAKEYPVPGRGNVPQSSF